MSSPSLPTTLCAGRYRLAERIGQGGMATVWRAWDELLRVERAIKVLEPGQDATALVRFLAEARAMAALRHDGAVEIHDLGQDGGFTFLVMDLCAGGTLWDWVRRHGPMPARLAVEALLPVAGALAAAHAAGIIHRDVKPQNVLLDLSGHPRLADFGIALARRADEEALTRTGAALGTWGYMAPEQRRDARVVDARADVYGLGATLHALLTGQAPVDLFAWDVGAELGPAVPSALRDLIRDATRFDPGDRPADMSALVGRLEALLPSLPPSLAGTPALRPPAPVVPHDGLAPTRPAEPAVVARRVRRWPWFAVGIGLLLAAALPFARRLTPPDVPLEGARPLVAPRRALAPAVVAPPPAAVAPARAPTAEVVTPAPAAVTPAPAAVTPAPAPEVLPPTPAAEPPTGSLVLRGDVFAAVAFDADGQAHMPGVLPPGTYDLRVTLTNGTSIARPGLVRIEPGQATIVRCLAVVENCRVEDGPGSR